MWLERERKSPGIWRRGRERRKQRMCPDTDGSCFEMHINHGFFCVCVCVSERMASYITPPIMTLNTFKSCNKYKRKQIQNGIRTHPCFHRIQIFAYAPFFYISFVSSYTFLIHTTLLITLERALSQLHTYTSNCMAKTLVKPVPVELIETEGIRVDWYNDSFIAPLNI